MCTKTVTGSAHVVETSSNSDAGSGQAGAQTSAAKRVVRGADEGHDHGEQKRRRCSWKTKVNVTTGVQKEERSYAKSWMEYIHGNIVSQTSKRFITNLLSATAARVVEEPGDSSDDSDDFGYDQGKKPAGSMDLIQNTLNGISSRNDDNGIEGIGRYATVIQLGRNLWQSSPLTADEAKVATEKFFDDGSLPAAAEVLKAAQEAVRKDEERVKPFSGSTQAWAQYSQTDLAQIFNKWFVQIAAEKETPNKEQLAVLQVGSLAVFSVVFCWGSMPRC